MKIGFVVNDVKTEEPGFTTMRLATAAINMGHTVWVMGSVTWHTIPKTALSARATSVSQDEVQGLGHPSRPISRAEGGHGAHHASTISTS